LVLVLQRRHKKYKVRVVYITKASEKGKEVNGWVGVLDGWGDACQFVHWNSTTAGEKAKKGGRRGGLGCQREHT